MKESKKINIIIEESQFKLQITFSPLIIEKITFISLERSLNFKGVECNLLLLKINNCCKIT
jgi:hypothetical protein